MRILESELRRFGRRRRIGRRPGGVYQFFARIGWSEPSKVVYIIQPQLQTLFCVCPPIGIQCGKKVFCWGAPRFFFGRKTVRFAGPRKSGYKKLLPPRWWSLVDALQGDIVQEKGGEEKGTREGACTGGATTPHPSMFRLIPFPLVH